MPSEDSQEILAILWFGVSGVVDEGKIIGSPVQDGDQYNVHIDPSLSLRSAVSRGDSKVRQA